MGVIVAVIDKKGLDAAEPAMAMLETSTLRDKEAYGIASSGTVKIEESFQQLQKYRLHSSIAVGYASSKILKQDKPQPLKLESAAAVFDGRTYPTKEQKRDAEALASILSGDHEEDAKTWIKKTEGDFAFAIAEPERLIAGRDILGVRSFYYGENATFAGLASERKALWRIGIENTYSFHPGHVARIDESGFKFSVAKKLTYSKPEEVTIKTASERLRILLERAVKERVADSREVAVAFSGGLDSSIIAFLAKKSEVDVELVHVSLKNQSETEHAKRIADELKLPIHSHIYTEDDVLEALPMVLYLIEEPDPVKASIGLPLYWAAEKIAEKHLRVMLTGQGADELFAGYRKYVDNYLQRGSEKTQEIVFRDIVEMHKNNLERDFKICNFHGLELRLPFATYQVAKFAANLPIDLKIQPSYKSLRKLVLRQVAHNLGLPKEIVDRPKKAVQYSTGVSRVLKKLAKRESLSLKEYLDETFQTALRRRMPPD